MRTAELELARQAEIAYARTVRDYHAAQAGKTAKVGAGVTPRHASKRPSKGNAARQDHKPLTSALRSSVTRAHDNNPTRRPARQDRTPEHALKHRFTPTNHQPAIRSNDAERVTTRRPHAATAQTADPRPRGAQRRPKRNPHPH